MAKVCMNLLFQSLTSQSQQPWLLSLLMLLVVLVPFLPLFILLKKHKRKSLNLPPRPPGLPIIGNLHQLGEIPHPSMWKLSQKYGPIMLLRLGLKPTVIVSSPEMAKEVLKTHDADCCSRTLSYGPKRLTYNYRDLAFRPYGEYWREMRKLCVIQLFTPKRVQSFSYIREEEVRRLINYISHHQRYSPNDPVKLSEKIFALTNSTICRIAFGKSYELGEQFEIQKNVEEAMTLLSSFWAVDSFPFFGHAVDMFRGFHSRLHKCSRDFDAFFNRVIEEHLDPARPNQRHEDITDVLLALSSDETTTFPITKNYIKAILTDIFLGGIDTSSITIEWAMTELVRNPRIMKKVQSEIRSCIGNKPRVDESEIEKLSYLKMVVKETFRLHPPAPLLVPRETMRHCKIGSYDVCPKTNVLVNVWAIGRDIETWKEPNEFYPERFEDSPIDFNGQHFELLPFGAGRRMCPAMAMGLTNVEFTLANLLHCFDWDLPTGMKIEDISMDEVVGLTARKKDPLYLVPRKYTS